MATVFVKRPGASSQAVEDVDTVADLKRELGVGKEYSAKIGGKVVDSDYELSDDEIVLIARNEKGA